MFPGRRRTPLPARSIGTPAGRAENTASSIRLVRGVDLLTHRPPEPAVQTSGDCDHAALASEGTSGESKGIAVTRRVHWKNPECYRTAVLVAKASASGKSLEYTPELLS